MLPENALVQKCKECKADFGGFWICCSTKKSASFDTKITSIYQFLPGQTFNSQTIVVNKTFSSLLFEWCSGVVCLHYSSVHNSMVQDVAMSCVFFWHYRSVQCSLSLQQHTLLPKLCLVPLLHLYDYFKIASSYDGLMQLGLLCKKGPLSRVAHPHGSNFLIVLRYCKKGSNHTLLPAKGGGGGGGHMIR